MLRNGYERKIRKRKSGNLSGTYKMCNGYMYIAENKDEAAQIMLDEGMVSGDIELTKYMLDQQNWAVSNADTKETIKAVAKDYIAAGIITSDWTVDKVVETAWHPLAEKVSTK